MRTEPLVSILINNYNYDRFLADSIDSALAQTYSNIEVIVVDDGSTDKSRNIIAGYGEQIIPVLKSNGGQASALNEGFKAAKGEIMFFLDSDDLFHREKVQRIVSFFARHNLINLPVISFNSFEAIDAEDSLIDGITPHTCYPDWTELAQIRGEQYLKEGNYFFKGEMNEVCTSDQVYRFAAKYRYIPYIGMPNSCIALSHTLACQVFPLPVNSYKSCADNFMVKAASLLGSTYSTNFILTKYRFHGKNAWLQKENNQEVEEATRLIPDEYLNSKLRESGRKPVLSFLESMPADGFYRHYFGRNSASQLIKLAFDVVRFRLDSETFIFFVKTLARGAYYKFLCFRL